jgi:hypothetical protein
MRGGEWLVVIGVFVYGAMWGLILGMALAGH